MHSCVRATHVASTECTYQPKCSMLVFSNSRPFAVHEEHEENSQISHKTMIFGPTINMISNTIPADREYVQANAHRRMNGNHINDIFNRCSASSNSTVRRVPPIQIVTLYTPRTTQFRFSVHAAKLSILWQISYRRAVSLRTNLKTSQAQRTRSRE